MPHPFVCTVTNYHAAPMALRLEPWAKEYLLHQGAMLRFEFSDNPYAEAIESVLEPSGCWVLYGVSGSLVSVFHGEEEVETGYEAFPAPT